MTTLRKAVHEYLVLRRSLGFKLHKAGKALPAFVTFMEQQRASVITSPLALTWAQQPPRVGIKCHFKIDSTPAIPLGL